MKLCNYLELVGCTGRILRGDKRGVISVGSEKKLARLGIDEDPWLEMMANFEDCFSTFVGGDSKLRTACDHLQY
jgi:hypothetical protein